LHETEQLYRRKERRDEESDSVPYGRRPAPVFIHTGEARESLRIVFAARVRPAKGLRVLLEALTLGQPARIGASFLWRC